MVVLLLFVVCFLNLFNPLHNPRKTLGNIYKFQIWDLQVLQSIYLTSLHPCAPDEIHDSVQSSSLLNNCTSKLMKVGGTRVCFQQQVWRGAEQVVLSRRPRE